MIMARIVLLFAALLAPCALSAAEAEPSRFDQGLLWKISVPGKPASFVFGTLHLSAEPVLALPPEVARAFAQSTTFAAEVVLDGAERGGLQLAMIAPSPALPGLLGADWPQVDAQLALRGFPARLRAHLQPWAALVLLLKPERKDDAEVLDVMLTRRARREGKTVVGLESVAEQVGALSGLPQETQLSLLREAVSSSSRLESDTAAITRFYLAGDIAGAWALHAQNRSEVPEVRAHQEALSEALIDRRNIVFAKRSMPLIKAGGAFVAVGALHLIGPQGLPALLEAEGFIVERAD